MKHYILSQVFFYFILIFCIYCRFGGREFRGLSIEFSCRGWLLADEFWGLWCGAFFVFFRNGGIYKT